MNRSMLGIPAVTLVAFLGGCATSPHGNLSRSADRLDDNAAALARHDGGRYGSGSSRLEARLGTGIRDAAGTQVHRYPKRPLSIRDECIATSRSVIVAQLSSSLK